jgi:hypothetical protein
MVSAVMGCSTKPSVNAATSEAEARFHPHHPGGVSDTPVWIFFFLQIHWENAKGIIHSNRDLNSVS